METDMREFRAEDINPFYRKPAEKKNRSQALKRVAIDEKYQQLQKFGAIAYIGKSVPKRLRGYRVVEKIPIEHNRAGARRFLFKLAP